eukprot:gnl/Hemi2/6861_TR2330_c0_g1_i1.p1 gnl/Hemi2/6861_TR2330_c0_g1~~gnl/Hemi2/6861_TR2330_c0_g1_i1.p1  ORF type:complete len:459 (+),score=59.44 gnl/Hemi2/6861_TR2330_c0_g1_i1:235-1611(+)
MELHGSINPSAQWSSAQSTDAMASAGAFICQHLLDLFKELCIEPSSSRPPLPRGRNGDVDVDSEAAIQRREREEIRFVVTGLCRLFSTSLAAKVFAVESGFVELILTHIENLQQTLTSEMLRGKSKDMRNTHVFDQLGMCVHLAKHLFLNCPAARRAGQQWNDGGMSLLLVSLWPFATASPEELLVELLGLIANYISQDSEAKQSLAPRPNIAPQAAAKSNIPLCIARLLTQTKQALPTAILSLAFTCLKSLVLCEDVVTALLRSNFLMEGCVSIIQSRIRDDRCQFMLDFMVNLSFSSEGGKALMANEIIVEYILDVLEANKPLSMKRSAMFVLKNLAFHKSNLRNRFLGVNNERAIGVILYCLRGDGAVSPDVHVASHAVSAVWFLLQRQQHIKTQFRKLKTLQELQLLQRELFGSKRISHSEDEETAALRKTTKETLREAIRLLDGTDHSHDAKS